MRSRRRSAWPLCRAFLLPPGADLVRPSRIEVVEVTVRLGVRVVDRLV